MADWVLKTNYIISILVNRSIVLERRGDWVQLTVKKETEDSAAIPSKQSYSWPTPGFKKHTCQSQLWILSRGEFNLSSCMSTVCIIMQSIKDTTWNYFP